MRIEYDIVLSQIYRVPVLYLQLPEGAGHGVQGIQFIHDHLVAKPVVPDLARIGVLGGVTMTVCSR